MAIESLPPSSVITTGRLTTASRSRIATCGWLMTGVAMIEPNWPGLVIVNVPSWTSSGLSVRDRAERASSLMRLESPSAERSCAERITGTMSPSSPSDTAMPRLTSSWTVWSSP
jgi:hypothetical protein